MIDSLSMTRVDDCIIRVTHSSSPYIANLHLTDELGPESHMSRDTLHLKSLAEVRGVIRELTKLLPVVDRLANVSADAES